MSQVPSLTATHVYHHATCEHRVRLDLFGDGALRLPDTGTESALKARGLAHEAAIAAARDYPRPTHGHDDLSRAFEETLALMGEGREGIYQGVLLSDGFIGMPDLLVRQEGPSRLGAHHYTVGDVKISRRARSDQALQVAFYAHLLGLVQGRIPERLFLQLGDGREEWFAYEDVGGAFEQVLADLVALREGRRETEAFLQPACSACPWRGLCLGELEARGDLSLVPGMTPSRRRALRRADVATVAELAGAKVERLEAASGLEAPSLTLLVRQARALAEDRPVPIGRPHRPPGPPELLVTALENPAGDGHTVLLTVSFTDPREGPRTALLWSEDPADEKALFEKALIAFSRKPDAPVYHYGPAAPSQMARMEARHGAGDRGLASLDRLTDVAAWVKRAAALPLNAYTLDATARATGHPGSDSAGDVLPDVFRLEEGDDGAKARLLAAADAEREAIRHLLEWLRRNP